MIRRILLTLVVLCTTVTAASAASIGHYAGGLANIRDLAVPTDAGFYAVMYNYYYQSGRINDSNGNEVKSVTIGGGGPGPGLTLGVKPDLDLYVLAPAFIWVKDLDFYGLRYGLLALPTFANSSVSAAIDAEFGEGRNPSTGQFNIGDTFIQPLWLGLSPNHFDLAFAWGFYAPTGKYQVDNVTLPVVGDRRVASADNIGLGFWTNQFQGNVTWYPFDNPGTAVVVASTYEIHSRKEDFHITPGDHLTLNWGVSQFLPLTKDQKFLAEVGPAGYDTWQVTPDNGQDRADADKSQVHGVGFQVGFTAVEQILAINFHYFYEVESQSRFQGHVIGLSIAKQI